MTSTKTKLLLSLVLGTVVGISPLLADEIKMKDGTNHSGRITYEGSDIVKIEIAISASIKETKILARGDILNITKDAPDDLEFNKLQKLVPTPSLMSASAYKSAIETGPVSFLKAYPDSTHVEPVKKIKATLEEELDKVERGFIKVESDWISPQDKVEFETLIESRIRFLRMQAAATTRNYNGIINAMRELEFIEENYYGTPALPKAIEMGLQLLPTFGNQLKGLLRDVEFRNAEFEKNKSAMDETARQQVEAARDREEKAYEAGLALDKKAGIRWVRLNPRSKKSIESYLKLAETELKRLKTYDLEGLKKQSAILAEVDQIASKGNLLLARAKLDEASGISTRISGSSKKKSSSSKKGKKGSYMSILRTKITDRASREEDLKKEREEAAKSQALTENLTKSSTSKGPRKPTEEEAVAVDPDAQKAKDKATADAFAALANSKKREVEAASKAKSKSGSKSSSKKSSSRDDDDDRDRPRAESGGGGISMSVIIPIITVLLVIVVVLLKVLGIGGNKEGDE